MKLWLNKGICLILLMCLFFGIQNPFSVRAENSISLTALGAVYFQNFDTLSSISESDTLPPGWVLAETKTNANSNYLPSTGNIKAGDTYSFGSANSIDRALGGIQDANLLPLFGASFKNNTGGVITSIAIEYTGEQWRSGKETRADKIKFEFSKNATSLSNGTWNPYGDLDFITPDTSRIGAKDGNAPAYRRFLRYTIETLSTNPGVNISINPGETFWIRWTDHSPSIGGDQDGLAVDDFSLTPLGIDNTPVLSTITPADNATHVALDSDISITFSEPVNLNDDWFTLSCSISNQHTVSITGGPQTFIVDPLKNFVFDDVCTIIISAENITDQDTIDPPDTLDKNYSMTFSAIPTPDTAPVVIGTYPANNDSAILLNTDLTIHFSEAVSLTPNWFTLICTSSGTHPAAVSGGPSTFILTPQNPFFYDETCVLNIAAQEVSDMDTEDPPDLMPLDASVTFSTVPTPDTAPFILTSTPENNELAIPSNQVIELIFNEPVTLGQNAVEITCESTSSYSYEISGGPSVYQIDPDQDFPFSDRCFVTVSALNVTDQDGNDPPDTMLMDQIINFETESDPGTPPSVLQTVPALDEINVAIDSNITITFSKNIIATEPWADLSCSISGTHSFVTGGTPKSLEIDPDHDFANSENCHLVIFGSQIHNQDTVDPPGGMAENYELTFSTAPLIDLPPMVVETNPADHAVDVPTSGYLSATFSEPIYLLPGWVTIMCNKSGEHFATLEGGPLTIKFASMTDFDYKEKCEITFIADKIYDLDDNDPPNFLSENYNYSFTTIESLDGLTFPTIVDDGNTFPTDGNYLYESINHLLVHFSEDVLHDGSSDAANNPHNYKLVERGVNNVFETDSCNALGGDDRNILINRVAYNSELYQSDIFVNDGTILPNGNYRFIICGDNTIRDLDGNPLNNGVNSTITFTVMVADVVIVPTMVVPPPHNDPDQEADEKTTATVTSTALFIPVTGFPHGVITALPLQQTAYTDLGDLWLDVPSMALKTTIQGVFRKDETWDVTWLGSQAGWLEGSALPGLAGNSVLTAHVWDSLNQPGPFYGLEKLKYGDQVIVHAWGDEYVYEVREVLSVKPENVKAMMKHQDKAWLTLVTCRGYDETEGEYLNRVLVRAVLMEIK